MSETTVSGNTVAATSTAQAGMKKYRTTHRRIDYFPAANILAIIEQHRGTLDDTLAGTIDALIAAGHQAMISGKDKGKGAAGN